ncbi:ornithine cyclodeaminase family protein [Microbacterium sp. CPCC 204701]|uniref:ornithine cyclodeaminase family protein n=1 Tax=Microbacterium sp. CPCC 204701 TaxID=2493084 RepID=UPI000FDC2DEE|nr:ornithine cyclodeaminase family protein [Microbacterium sp. CPCC 204701]
MTAPRILGGALAIDADLIARAVRPSAAMDAILSAARSELSEMPARTVHSLGTGEVFLMPAHAEADVGIKILSLQRSNPRRGLPAVQGVHLVLDATTMSLRAILDGAALTTLRTPAVPLAVVRDRLIAPGRPVSAVVYGTGPQGRSFVRSIRDIVAVSSLSVVSRRDVTIEGAVTVRPGSAEERDALATADLVACATSSVTPIFDGMLLGPRTTVVAVGAHEAGARELDARVFDGATVVVEDRDTALREAGDVILAIAAGATDAADLVQIADIARGNIDLRLPSRVVVKTTGLAWQDVVVARVVLYEVEKRAERRRRSGKGSRIQGHKRRRGR